MGEYCISIVFSISHELCRRGLNIVGVGDVSRRRDFRPISVYCPAHHLLSSVQWGRWAATAAARTVVTEGLFGLGIRRRSTYFPESVNRATSKSAENIFISPFFNVFPANCSTANDGRQQVWYCHERLGIATIRRGSAVRGTLPLNRVSACVSAREPPVTRTLRLTADGS